MKKNSYSQLIFKNITSITLSMLMLTSTFPAISQVSSQLIHYSEEDGLPQNRVGGIYQSKNGLIWILTHSGLASFDGKNFKSYLTPTSAYTSVRDNWIRQITEDQSENIWIKTHIGDVYRLNQKNESLVNITTILSQTNLNFKTERIRLTRTGKVWLSSAGDGAVCFNDDQLNFDYFGKTNFSLRSDTINNIYEDNDGITWILTANGLHMFQSEQTKSAKRLRCINYFTGCFHTIACTNDEIFLGTQSGAVLAYHKRSKQMDTLTIDNNSPIQTIVKKKDNLLIIGTLGNGFFTYQTETSEIAHYNSANTPLKDNNILSIHADHYGNCWLEVQGPGIYRFDTNEKTVFYYATPLGEASPHLGSSFIFSVDKKTQVWMRPPNGVLSCYDPVSKKLILFNQSKFTPYPNYPNDIYNFNFDDQNNMWISPSTKGIDKITFTEENFQKLTLTAVEKSADNDIRAILEDSNGLIWIASKEGNIRIIDQNKKLKGFLCNNGTIGAGEKVEGVAYCLFEDRMNNIWIGTRGNGLYFLRPNNGKYHIKHFSNNPQDKNSLGNDNIYSINEDSVGRIWIGTWGDGINLCEVVNNEPLRFINSRNGLVSYPHSKASFIRYISPEKKGKVYVASNAGLVVFDTSFKMPGEIEFQFYEQGDIQSGAISQGDVLHVCHSGDGHTYLATSGGGVNFVSEWTQHGYPKRFSAITRKDGLGSDNVLSIVEDGLQNLWFISENGVTRYRPGNNSFRIFPSSKLFPSGLYGEGARVITRNQEILLGSTLGLVCFSPAKITSDNFAPEIILTSFSLFNRTVPVNGTKYYTSHINNIKKLVLKPKDKIFSISFSALDYRAPSKIHYAYKLDGFDDKWNYIGNQNTASFMNLSNGEYLLRIKSTNAFGEWVENERQLQIERLPTFWQTTLGRILSFLFIIFFIIGGVYTLFTIFRMKDRVKMKSQMAELKLRFFTDISHEIRTSLTLIDGPVDNILSKPSTPQAIKNQLNIVRENAVRMLEMINQILDLRRAEHGRLKIEQLSLNELVTSVCSSFTPLAEGKNIEITTQDSTAGKMLWADKDALKKILFNLLSNSFKFSKPDTTIHLKTAWEPGRFIVQISDQGIGIVSEHLPSIFQRFYSVNTAKESTGIGLSLVKELVEKQKGHIQVESTPNSGTTFTIFFQEGFDHFKGQYEIIVDQQILGNTVTPGPVKASYHEPEKNAEKPTVLIVEDDPGLRDFLFSLLIEDYQILLCTNGKEGYNEAVKQIPDLIVSDLIMLEMNGIEMLSALRKNILTSHVPVVLLTAVDETDEKLKGMAEGADDYITKPFSVPYFKARIQNLIMQRKNLRYMYSSELSSSLKKYENICCKGALQLDQEFLDAVVRQIELHLDNSEYSIDVLAKSTGINRTAFFKKIKSLTGMAPIEFIRDIRLQNAANMLCNENLLVKEVIYRVGFSDLKYFTRCFKEKFNLTPSEYRLRNLIVNAI